MLTWLLGQAAAGHSDAEIAERLLLRIAVGHWPGRLASRTYEAAKHLLPSRAYRRTVQEAAHV